MNEEIIAKFGANTSEIDRAMRGLKTRAKEFASSVKSLFNFPTVAGVLSVGALIAAFDKLTQRVDTIKRISETTGLDTGMVQDLTNLAKAAGIADSKVEKMLGAFTKHLKPGASPAEELSKIADKLALISDPGERARYAVEALGESGVKLIPVLSKGSAEVKKLAEEFGRMSDAQIELIDRTGDKIDAFKTKSQVFAAKIIEGIDLMAEARKRTRAGNTNNVFEDPDEIFNLELTGVLLEQKLASMNRLKAKNKERAEAQASAAKTARKAELEAGMKAMDALLKLDRDNSFKRANDVEKLKILERELATARKELGIGDMEKRVKAAAEVRTIEFQILDVLDRQKKSTDETARKRLEAEQRLKAAKANALDQFRPTLGDLADNRGPMQGDARRAQSLQERIKSALIAGNQAEADRLTTELYGGVSETKDQKRLREVQNFTRRNSGMSELGARMTSGLIPDLMASGMAEDPVVTEINTLKVALEKVLTEKGIKVSELVGG